jgi:hypothetical protein
MPRPVRKLSNMEIDEISLVDKGANQHAMITIAKRAPEEETMPELYTEDGELLDENTLTDGDVVYDEAGNAYEFTLEEEEVEEREPELVGKSARPNPFERKAPVSKKSEKSFTESVLEELSKAYSDEDRDAVIAKALGRVEELETRYSKAEEIAKSERDLRLTREYISKAAEYNLPVDPAELGPVLYRMAETMSYDDCSVIAKCLEGAGAMIFEEQGYIGGGDNADIMSQVEAQAVEIGKAATPETVTAVFDSTPEAYNEYLASQRGRY